MSIEIPIEIKPQDIVALSAFIIKINVLYDSVGLIKVASVFCSEPDCRRKWKMLRDQHRRERYRERERRESGVGLLNYRPWRYAAILSFLNPFIDARAAGTNGWALDPRTPQQDMVGCSMNMETRSDDDDSYGGTGSSRVIFTSFLLLFFCRTF